MKKDSNMLLKANWFEGDVPVSSYRSLFKWGNLNTYKHPNRRLTQHIKNVFNLKDTDFDKPQNLGLESLDIEIPVTMSKELVNSFAQIVGEENIRTDTYIRIGRSYGKTMIDLLRLRSHIIENIPDLVICPRSREDVIAVLNLCRQEKIPVYVFGAGSSVTRGFEAVKGGICLDMSTHMNRILEVNDIDQTVTVQPGIWGPALEQSLNNARELHHAAHNYTCGHFPQSFEYSSVGGWIVTRGAGQNSTHYGKIEDLVLAQEYVTPAGVIRTKPYPRAAIGPDVDQIMIGSEGSFGILTEATLKIFRRMHENTKRFSYLFKSWEEGLAAVREIMQSEAGTPSVFRLSDPEETDIAMKMYGVEGTAADTVLKSLGYLAMQRCLLLGSVDGEKHFCKNLQRTIHNICTGYPVFPLGLFNITKMWEKSRFLDPYMREDLQDFGISLDTLECAVTWSQLKDVYQSVRAFIKQKPHMVCMTHLSHMYPQGTNLYFIFITRFKTPTEYLDLLYGILDVIQESGAAVSHHHGVGKQTAPWLEGQLGTEQMNLLHALKHHFDPDNILNPGGTLGLDLSPEQLEKRWGYNALESDYLVK